MGGWRLCTGRRGGGGCREGKWGTGELSGEGVVLLGPGCDQGPQGCMGSKDPVVTVVVDAGWREDLGEAVEERQGGEAQRHAACGIGVGQEVEDLTAPKEAVRGAVGQASWSVVWRARSGM